MNKLIKKFNIIHINEEINKMDIEREETEPKVIQPVGNMDTECKKDHHNPQPIKQYTKENPQSNTRQGNFNR